MTLEALNGLGVEALREALRSCCGSSVWVEKMTAIFPVADRFVLFAAAEEVWRNCSEKDWREAFSHHPKIGDLEGLKKKFAAMGAWAAAEQSGTSGAATAVLEALQEGNRVYEEKFGYIFIVCATGKPAAEMLGSLRERLGNDAQTEILIAMGEQEKITYLRLQKLLS